MADTTIHDDNVRFNGTVTLAGGLVETATATPAAGSKGTVIGAFTLSHIQAGTRVLTNLPANAIVTGIAIRVTTALTFSAGTTTGVTVKVGGLQVSQRWRRPARVPGRGRLRVVHAHLHADWRHSGPVRGQCGGRLGVSHLRRSGLSIIVQSY